MDEIKTFFDSMNKLYTEQHELAAIWLEKPLLTANGKTVRICPDTLVCVKDGELVDCHGEPTHKVIGCLGAMYSQFEFTLIDLKTNEPLQIKL